MNNKRYRLVIATVLIGGLVGGMAADRFFRDQAVYAQRSPEPAKVIAAEQFLIVDKDGRPKAKLGLWPNGRPGLFVYDADGIPRTSFNVVADGPKVTLMDKDGKVIWSAP